VDPTAPPPDPTPRPPAQPVQVFEDREAALPPGQIALWLSGDAAMQFKGIAVRESK
jgi:hypothetical protein